MPPTFQERVLALADDPIDAERGLRFCYGAEVPTHAGIFLPWARVAARLRALAGRLADAGLGGGDVALVHCHDQQTALIAILACVQLGALPAAVAPIATGTAERLVDQFHAIVAVAGARMIVTDHALPAEHCAGRASLPPTLIVEHLDEAERGPDPRRRATLDDACFLQFTSGSTSVPKGVVVTHRMLAANISAITAALAWGGHGRSVGWLPIYHDMSLVGCYGMAVWHRARACFFPTTRFGRSPDLWMRLMAEERADFSAGPNSAFALVVRHGERRPPVDIDLSSVRGIICGSEPIAAEVMHRFDALHAVCGLRHAPLPAYGMAECTLMATACPPGAAVRALSVERAALEGDGTVRVCAPGDGALDLVDCGAPAEGMAVVIAASDLGTIVGEDRVGEVLLAGEAVLTRYWRDDAATAAAFAETAGRRWFRTGDLGFLHAGRLFICGRAKEVIIHNGVNHYPADVERAISERLGDDARLAAVVDLRRDINEAFAGLGVLFETASRDGDQAERERRIADFVAAYTGLPVAIALAARGGPVPRTTSGKLVRSQIRMMLAEELAARDKRTT